MRSRTIIGVSTLTVAASLLSPVGIAVALAGAAPGFASAAPATPLGTSAATVGDESSVRCHVELPVRVRGNRFVSSHSGTAIACVGLLLGQPVAAGALPRASGVARFEHWAQALPPRIGETQLSLEAVGPTLPLTPPDRTRIKVALAPDPATAPGAGHFTGAALISRREHRVAASLVFQPGGDPQSRRCCIAGRLILDLAVWNA